MRDRDEAGQPLEVEGTRVTDQASKLHQLTSGTSLTGRPMKEYVIETDSESSDSSSGSESSSDDDAQGSSSSSSLDTSNSSTEYLEQANKKERGRGRGRMTRGRVSRPPTQQETRPRQDSRRGRRTRGDRGKRPQRGAGLSWKIGSFSTGYWCLLAWRLLGSFAGSWGRLSAACLW